MCHSVSQDNFSIKLILRGCKDGKESKNNLYTYNGWAKLLPP